MNSKESKTGSKLYGYDATTYQDENDSDIKDLYRMASKDKASKLVVVGGLHGYEPTGEPTGQSVAEKNVCSFAMGDQTNKSVGKGINFVYKNIARYTTDGSDVTPEKQQEIAKQIKDYLNGGYYVLLSWCFSVNWAKSMGL